MKISIRLYNALGLLLVVISFLIQSWLSIFQLATMDITFATTTWFNISVILFITGSVLLADTNINWLYAIYHRINYVISMIGLAGLSILIVFLGYIENFLFPSTTIVYLLILDFFWILFLGLLLNRFKTMANKGITTN